MKAPERPPTLEDAMAFAPLAEAKGVDLFNVTGGWHETKVPQLTGDLPRGGLSYLGKGIRSVVSVPVMMCNRVTDPTTAEKLLALGRADLVGFGRPLIADPDLPNKALAAQAEQIRPCMACNQGCLANTFFDRPITCLVNGICGRELQYPIVPAQTPKKILVIGGGVSNEGENLLRPLVECVRPQLYIRTPEKQTRIVLATLGNDAGLIGAAVLNRAR